MLPFPTRQIALVQNHWHEWGRIFYVRRRGKKKNKKKKKQETARKRQIKSKTATAEKKVRRWRHFYSVKHERRVISPHIKIIGDRPRSGPGLVKEKEKTKR